MINKAKLTLIAAIAAFGIASPAFAQVFDGAVGTGNILPMVYDAQGAKHRYVYGYYGPLVPPIAPQNDQIVVGESRLHAASMAASAKSASNHGAIRQSLALGAP